MKEFGIALAGGRSKTSGLLGHSTRYINSACHQTYSQKEARDGKIYQY
jgi:hypothetical protein